MTLLLIQTADAQLEHLFKPLPTLPGQSLATPAPLPERESGVQFGLGNFKRKYSTSFDWDLLLLQLGRERQAGHFDEVILALSRLRSFALGRP